MDRQFKGQILEIVTIFLTSRKLLFLYDLEITNQVIFYLFKKIVKKFYKNVKFGLKVYFHMKIIFKIHTYWLSKLLKWRYSVHSTRCCVLCILQEPHSCLFMWIWKEVRNVRMFKHERRAESEAVLCRVWLKLEQIKWYMTWESVYVRTRWITHNYDYDHNIYYIYTEGPT